MSQIPSQVSQSRSISDLSAAHNYNMEGLESQESLESHGSPETLPEPPEIPSRTILIGVCQSRQQYKSPGGDPAGSAAFVMEVRWNGGRRSVILILTWEVNGDARAN